MCGNKEVFHIMYFSHNLLKAIHREIDTKYPNRILMDTGLVISRYGDCLHVDHGVCVPSDGGSHHECSFRLIVFRPFVEEVVLGKLLKSTPEGVQVSLGFFSDIFIPAYWMLNPSRYEKKSGLWVWTPQYDDEEEMGGESGVNDEAENHYEMYLGYVFLCIYDLSIRTRCLIFLLIKLFSKG